jgi:hypothetical protein
MVVDSLGGISEDEIARRYLTVFLQISYDADSTCVDARKHAQGPGLQPASHLGVTCRCVNPVRKHGTGRTGRV